MKEKLSFEAAQRGFRRFPVINPKKSVAQKQQESIPLERIERRALGLSHQYKTADRLLIFDRPVNRSAKSVTKPRAKPKLPPHSVSVYLLRFTSVPNPYHSFLKIGVTNDLSARFGLDLYRHTWSLLKVVKKLTRREALKVEGRLHRMFASKSYTPSVKLLSGGNSECFVDDQEIIDTVGIVFDLIKKEISQRSSDGEQPRRKGKRADSRPAAGTMPV